MRLTVEHLFQIGTASDPQIRPEGEWIAYTIERHNTEVDETRSRAWMVPREGGEALPLTAVKESSSHPRWSPDG